MVKQTLMKQERIIEAVRHGLDGEAAVEFIHQSGYAMNLHGLQRFVQSMGGRKRLQELIGAGLSNGEILARCFPGAEAAPPETPPSQGVLFSHEEVPESLAGRGMLQPPLFETTKLTLSMPSDLYEAVSLAAKAEGKRRNDLIVEVLTAAMSRMPSLREGAD